MNLPRLYFITQDLPNRSHQEQALSALQGGAKLIQLRIKNPIMDSPIKTGLEILKMCIDFGAKLIINDDILLAKACKAHGVHLGIKDESISQARKFLGPSAIIGGTANTHKDVSHQISQGANYIGLGPYQFTHTKKKLSPILGISDYNLLTSEFKNIPIFAIGGITSQHVKELMQAGVYGIAVSSFISLSHDPKLATQSLNQLIHSNHLVTANG